MNAAEIDLGKTFVEHHGVKGMHWGVRTKSGGVTKGKQTSRTTFEKAPKRLSTSELERRIKRMETEKRYNDLNKRDISPGEKLATEIVTNVGRTVVTTIATGAMLLAVRQAINKKMGVENPKLDLGALITKRGK